MYIYNIKDLIKLQAMGAKFIINSTSKNVSISSNIYVPGLNPRYVSSKEN